MRVVAKAGLLGAAILGRAAASLSAQEAAPPPVFVLGTITLTVEDRESRDGTTTSVTAEQVLRANRSTLDDALRVAPGVQVGHTGGSRYERLIHVRGFDRFQVPLSIDGIRVTLPADNRLDYGRFLTPDLAEIQLQEGYVSVLNGPGGMGGAINLVTRQPVRAFQGEARLGVEAGNRGDIAARSGLLSLGMRRQGYWLQGSYMRRDSDGFYLSRDHAPRPQQGAGLRDHSDSDDGRLSLKAGWTPNATDEYVLSYTRTRQTGEKQASCNIDQPIRGATPPPGPGQGWQRDWTWPEWDLDSLAFYSHTELRGGYLKTRAYYDRFDNLLPAWDDASHSTQTERRAFDSRYKDWAWGLSLEAGAELGAADTLRAALHHRRDRHRSIQVSRPGLGGVPDPAELSEEETWSLALENTWQARDDLRVIAGISHDRAEVLQAERNAEDAGLPAGSTKAVNWQLAAIWLPDARGASHASLSSRSRFPTLFDRYSTRFGSAVPNPELKSERALNVELGYGGDLGPARIETALSHSKARDMIQSVPTGGLNDEGKPLSQSRNVGDGTCEGFEIAASWDIGDRLGLAAGYPFLLRDLSDPVRADYRPTDTSRHNAYLRPDWRTMDRLTVSPSVEISGARLSESAVQPEDPARIAYARMAFGIRNLFDRDHQPAEGFPEPGRSFFLTTRMTF
ncbi:TonB-dependent receptor plug domain-containing protein [Paracoccus binzhouensis]|uniref:TonB-dependent receptor plug domain-containing protein n=1 Tax=Paracoccus binzhouensis TaxID=2796149 RepID=UPI0018EF2A56|nr:TonB-dependent receptor [Paracoccus binzhouensis]